MEEEIKISKDLLKSVSTDTRVDILKLLEQRSMTASEISRSLNKHVTTVSEHLEVLKKSNLVVRIDRPGKKWVYYKLSKDADKILHPQSYYRFALILSVIAAIAIASLFSLVYYQRTNPTTVPITNVGFLTDQANLLLDQQLQQSTSSISSTDVVNTVNSPT